MTLPLLILIPVIIYSAFLCRMIFKLKSRMAETTKGKPVTKISVVVACKNEEDNITKLLESILKQDYPHHLFETIVVDDNSTDKTAVIVNNFIRLHDGNIRLITNIASGKKSALFNGIKESTGELIIVTDADCVVSPGWVRSYEALYLQESPDMIAGRVTCNRGNSFVSAFGRYEFAALQSVTEAMIISCNPIMSGGANMAFSKRKYLSHVEKLRMDIDSGDDVFLLHAIKKDGGKICWNDAPEAAVNTTGAATPGRLLRQRARWASKATQYKDSAAILTAIVVFAANTALLSLVAGSFYSTSCFYMLPVAFILKAVPDGIIINKTLVKEKEKLSLLLFLIMDMLYPVYFISVFVLSFFPSMKRFSAR
jgi:poly-beta-1,6-N-acetyl-D-glucosamine synthase